jgi:hypothetical protein
LYTARSRAAATRAAVVRAAAEFARARLQELLLAAHLRARAVDLALA